MFVSLLFPSDTFTYLTGHVSVYVRGHRQQSSKSAAVRQDVTWKKRIKQKTRLSDDRHNRMQKIQYKSVCCIVRAIMLVLIYIRAPVALGLRQRGQIYFC